MAYDRYDPRDERSRWRGERHQDRGPGEDRGFFERAGDEIASWFGDDEADRRRHQDQRMEGQDRGWGRDYGGDRSFRTDDNRSGFAGRDRDWNRGHFARGERGGFTGSSYRGEGGYDRPASAPDYSPPGSGATRNEGFFRGSGDPRGEFDRGSSWRGQESRFSNQHMDPHYHSWRQRQLDDLDRDYEEYRNENQARFENDFTNWRQRRQMKRSLLADIREHMEVVGNDDQHVGTVDRIAGDRIILAKSDPDSGGVHHSLSCSDIDRIEGDRVFLDLSAEDAKRRWRDENRGRALFEREDQGDMGDRVLDRSFEGTYR